MQKWMRWTVLEATTKIVVRGLQKTLGNATASMSGLMGILVIAGAVQWCLGVLARTRSSIKIQSDTGSKIGAVLFGCGALACNVLILLAFQYGGSVIVVTFIGTLSIIPGALLDRFWFKHKLGAREWAGIFLGIFGGYAILGFPSLAEVILLPLWVWLALLEAIALTFNQFVVQTTKRMHPYAQNMWGGGTIVMAALIVGTLGDGVRHLAVSSVPVYVGASIVIGVVTFGMWSFSLFAYKEGAFISLKKLTMNASYLTGTVILGVTLFGESLSVHHFIGFALYLAALLCMDNAAWGFVRETVLRKVARA